MRTYPTQYLIDAIREWTAIVGEPPTVKDWGGPKIRGPEREARYRATGRSWPSSANVAKRFGSWKAALKAAGVKRPPPTHCKRGHKLSGRNLYIAPDGRRRCLTCKRRTDRRSVARRMAKTNPLPLESLPPSLRRKIEAERAAELAQNGDGALQGKSSPAA